MKHDRYEKFFVESKLKEEFIQFEVSIAEDEVGFFEDVLDKNGLPVEDYLVNDFGEYVAFYFSKAQEKKVTSALNDFKKVSQTTVMENPDLSLIDISEIMSESKKHFTESYNGWANYETWSIFTWITSDENAYRMMDKQKPFDARSAQRFAMGMFPHGTPDMDSPREMNKVNWNEIADAFNE